MDNLRCLFCQNDAGSLEHVWTDWLRRFITRQLEQNGAPDHVVIQADRDLGMTTDRVCRSCNLGWMKRLEDRVSTVLKRMILGSEVHLSDRDIEALRRWAIKMAVVLETLYQETPVTSQRLRRAVQRGDDVHALVILGVMPAGRVRMGHERTIWVDPDNADFLLSWQVLVLGKVFVGVLTDHDVRNPSATLGPDGDRYFVRLNKGIDPFIWPSREPLSEAAFNDLIRGPHPDLRNAPRLQPGKDFS